MRTEDLVRALAEDSASRPEPMARRFVTLAIIGALAAAGVFASTLAVRPDFHAVMATPPVAFKFLLTLTLVGAAGALAFRRMRPEDGSHLKSVVFPVLSVLILGVAVELISSPVADWPRLLIGSNALACVTLVPLLSLLPLSLILTALRYGAPTHPQETGAVAGLFAGGIGAALYAFHCPDDSPLFVAAWYGLSVGIVATLGAMLGARWLRW